MIDLMSVKLGRPLPPVFDPRTLKVERYLPSAKLSPPPAELSWLGGQTSWGALMNNTLGNCTIAAPGHGIQVISKAVDVESIVTDAMALKYYELWDGYVLNDPSTDQGGVIIDVLNKWRKQGFNKHDLLGYASTEISNHVEVMQAIAILGGLDIGLLLPVTAQGQTEWMVVGDGQTGNSAPGSWGGHSVWVAGYNVIGPIVISWGIVIQMTWAFWDAYVDEAYPCLLRYWAKKVASPSGFNLAQLLSDLPSLGS